MTILGTKCPNRKGFLGLRTCGFSMRFRRVDGYLLWDCPQCGFKTWEVDKEVLDKKFYEGMVAGRKETENRQLQTSSESETK